MSIADGDDKVFKALAAPVRRAILDALRDDHAFLLKGGVFTKDFIEGYLELRYAEVKAYETMPHPIEFSMYYSV